MKSNMAPIRCNTVFAFYLLCNNIFQTLVCDHNIFAKKKQKTKKNVFYKNSTISGIWNFLTSLLGKLTTE